MAAIVYVRQQHAAVVQHRKREIPAKKPAHEKIIKYRSKEWKQ